MKKVLLFALLFISGISYGQGVGLKPRYNLIGTEVSNWVPIVGYTSISSRYLWLAGAFSDGLHIPQYNGVPTDRANVWMADGAVAVDTSAGYFYWRIGGVWIKGAKFSDVPSMPVTIYSGDGTISGDRIVSGGGSDINWNNMGEFNILSGVVNRYLQNASYSRVFSPNGLSYISHENAFLYLTSQGVNGLTIRPDTTTSSKPIKYTGNFHSLLTGHSLIDRDMADSLINASPAGTVTSISQAYGIINTPNPIVSTGTVKFDSATVFPQALGTLLVTNTGTSGAATYTAGSRTLNIPQYQAALTNPVTGTGAANQVTYWTGTNAITGLALNTGALKVLTQTSSGSPAWTDPATLTGQRFGVSGEDATAAQTRSFNLNSRPFTIAGVTEDGYMRLGFGDDDPNVLDLQVRTPTQTGSLQGGRISLDATNSSATLISFIPAINFDSRIYVNNIGAHISSELISNPLRKSYFSSYPDSAVIWMTNRSSYGMFKQGIIELWADSSWVELSQDEGIEFYPWRGKLRVDSLTNAAGVMTGKDVIVWDSTSGYFEHIHASSISAGNVPINGLTASTGTNSITVGHSQTWDFSSLVSSNNGFNILSTSTAGTTLPNLFYVRMLGANSNSGVTSTAASFINNHSGATSTNIAAAFDASGGTTNIAISVGTGNVVLSPLTASQFVSLDASKNLTSTAVASSILAASLTNETGTNLSVFNTNPSLVLPTADSIIVDPGVSTERYLLRNRVALGLTFPVGTMAPITAGKNFAFDFMPGPGAAPVDYSNNGLVWSDWCNRNVSNGAGNVTTARVGITSTAVQFGMRNFGLTELPVQIIMETDAMTTYGVDRSILQNTNRYSISKSASGDYVGLTLLNTNNTVVESNPILFIGQDVAALRFGYLRWNNGASGYTGYRESNQLEIATNTASTAGIVIASLGSGKIKFVTSPDGNGGFERMRIDSVGNVGIGVAAPSAILHLKAGSTSANTAPLKFNAGAPTTTPVAGQLMFNTGMLILDSTASHRDTLATRNWVRNNVTGGGGATPGIDDVLAVGQQLSTDRVLNQNDKILEFRNAKSFLVTGTSNGNTFSIEDATSIVYLDNTAHSMAVGINTATPSVALDVVNDFWAGRDGTYTNALIKTDVATGIVDLGDKDAVVGGTWFRLRDQNQTISLAALNGIFLDVGAVTIGNLAGTGSRTVVADASGILSTTAGIPPSIVASADLTAQTTTVSSVTTYTPGADGSYQVIVYSDITAISAATLTITCTYTDTHNNARTATFYGMGTTTAGIGALGSSNFPPIGLLRVKGGTAITVVSTFSGVSITYDVSAKIIALQ